MDNILNGKEVANILKVSNRHVTRLAEQGKLPGFQVGNLWRFRQKDLEEYIEKSVTQNTEKNK